MNKNILKLSIILLLVCSFTLPSLVNAYTCNYPLQRPSAIEQAVYVFELFFIILFFLIIIPEIFLKSFKARFSAIKHKKIVSLGIAVLLTSLFFGVYDFWNDIELFLFLFLILSFLIITFVLFLKVFNITFCKGEYIKNTLISIASLILVMFFIGIYWFLFSFISFDSLFFGVSYTIFLTLIVLFIKFFKARLSIVKYFEK